MVYSLFSIPPGSTNFKKASIIDDGGFFRYPWPRHPEELQATKDLIPAIE